MGRKRKREEQHVTCLDHILCLDNQCLTVEAIQSLCERLKENKTVTHLSLNKTQLKDEGVKILSRFLNGNTTLKILSLENNLFDTAGYRALAYHLKFNRTLEKLYLAGNKQSALGWFLLGETLIHNHSLMIVGFSSQGRYIFNDVVEEMAQVNNQFISRPALKVNSKILPAQLPDEVQMKIVVQVKRSIFEKSQLIKKC